jgi:putative ABC transport system permease protein
VAEAARDLPEVDSVASVRFLTIEIEGDGEIVGAVNPDVEESLFDVGLVAGEYADLDETGIAVHESKAEELGLELGDPVPVRFVETGDAQLTVRAIFEDGDLVGDWFVGIPLAEANVPDQFDFQVYIDLAPGVSPEAGRSALERLIEDVPTAELQNQQEFRDAQTAQLNPILALVYALLAFSVWIALIGIANTLALSVFERTREIGLLRAVGMTRSQVRSMVRWESVIVALLGTVLGLVLGTGFAWALITANADEGLNTLSIPAGQLAIIAVIAGLAGVWAARRPAKRAAKLDVLQAISTT